MFEIWKLTKLTTFDNLNRVLKILKITKLITSEYIYISSISFILIYVLCRYTFLDMLMCLFNIVYSIYWPSVCKYWAIRKTYQTSIYKFNSYHELNLFKRKWRQYDKKYFYKYTLTYTYTYLIKLMKVFFVGLRYQAIRNWYTICWLFWVLLTIHLYFHEKTRDLGPSYDIYDYNPEDDMGIYLTIGPFLLLSWFCWTVSADTVFVKLMKFFLYKLFLHAHSKINWYLLTIYSFIENAFL